MSESSSPPPDSRLALLYLLSQAFNSSLDLDEVLNRVMDGVIQATRAERGFAMLVEEPGEARPNPTAFAPVDRISGSGIAEDNADAAQASGIPTFVFRAARGMDQQTIQEPRFQVSRSVVERVARDGQPVLTNDAQMDERFNIRQSVMFLGLRSILCVPLRIKDRTIGVIYVDSRLQAGIFTHADLELLTAIASSAAIAIENARLYQVAVEKGRLEREMQMARTVQASLLPSRLPELPGWEFAAKWKPARQVAGDYYDFIPHAGGLGIVIGDVTDKGLPAALFMVFARSVVRASLEQSAEPAAAIAQANHRICAETTRGLFITLVFAHLDPASGQLTYVNAGHNPPLVYQAAARRLIPLENTGYPVGVEEDFEYQQRGMTLKPGDFVVFYTDGVIEAIDDREDQYGVERLQKAILAAKNLPPIGILATIEQDLADFTGGATPFDDITLVVVRRAA